jgi:hypothetical protein
MQHLLLFLTLSTCFLNCGCKPSRDEQPAEEKALSNTIREIRLKEIEETRKALEELRKPIEFPSIVDGMTIEELNMRMGFNPAEHTREPRTDAYIEAKSKFIEQQRLIAQSKREAHEKRLKETEKHLRALLGVESKGAGPSQSPN